ncbi:MAG: dienelactone hydrolase family protein [Thalassospira sp.]|uniref:dienelactone hydrolase family protein n=1 Tax=Thalassospira sp. TaxID=1912094 RepID=UPI003A8671F2
MLALIGSLTVALTTPAYPQDQGLHNSTKTFAAPEDLSWKDWDDPTELERTWQAAIVRMPINDGQSKQVTASELATLSATQIGKLPTVIYLHGCSGIWPGTHTRIKFLADNGFLVIAPASMARKTYPRSCNVETREGGLFRGTLVLRKNDAGYAIEKARTIPLVDSKNMILMGFSEGALATVTFEAQNPRQTVRARIAEGWTCHTPWPEDRGVNAPPSEPVLTLLGVNDPWHQNRWTAGNCQEFLNPDNGSKSIIYRSGKIADQHGLLEFSSAQNDILSFLKQHLGN